MTGNIVIFVTDQRQSNLAACLPGKIHRLDWRRGVEKEEALKVLDNSRYLVLPVPVTKIERNHDVNLILKEELTREKERDWMLFGLSHRGWFHGYRLQWLFLHLAMHSIKWIFQRSFLR